MHYHDAIIAAVAAAIAAKESNMSAVTEADNQNDAEQDEDIEDFLDMVASGNTDHKDLAKAARRMMSKRRAPMTQEKYLAEGGLRCPSCSSSSIHTEDNYPVASGIVDIDRCDDCGATWRERYELKSYFCLTR